MLTHDECVQIIERFRSDPNFNMPALLEVAINRLIQLAETQREAA